MSAARLILLLILFAFGAAAFMPVQSAFAAESGSGSEGTSGSGTSGGTSGGTGGTGTGGGSGAEPPAPYIPPPPYTVDTCAPGYQDWQLTSKLVTCINKNIRLAVAGFIEKLSTYMEPIVGLLFTFALVLFGVRLAGGERQLVPAAAGFLFRSGLILMFAFNLGGFAYAPFAIVDEGLSLLTTGAMGAPGWSPWEQIDLMLAKLVGAGPGLTMAQGVLGIIGAALYSHSMGLFLFLLALVAILILLNFIFRCVYTYLLCMLTIGYLVAISPLIIPLAFFGITERHMRKWLDWLLTVILIPILLFGFLWLFLSVVEGSIASIFQLFGGSNDFSAFWRNNVPVFSWNLVGDPSLFRNYDVLDDVRRPAMQSYMNPLGGGVMDLNLLRLPMIDFGANNPQVIQALIMRFASLGITCYLLISALDAMPSMAESIVGVNTTIALERLPFVDDVKHAIAGLAKGGVK